MFNTLETVLLSYACAATVVSFVLVYKAFTYRKAALMMIDAYNDMKKVAIESSLALALKEGATVEELREVVSEKGNVH